MISLDGVKSLAPTADTMGILARSVSDLKLFANALELFKKHPSQTLPKPVNQCKFAFVKTDQFDLEASQDLINIWAKAKEVLSKTGAEVVDLDLGDEYKGWMGEKGKFTLMCRAEGGVTMKREYVIGKDKMGEGLPEWVNDVNEISPQTLLQTRDDLAALRPKFDAVVGQYDAIVTFTVADTAPPMDSGGRPYLSSLWTGLHAPTVHVPGFAGEDGLPMGLTLVGARYKDQDLLEVAKVVADVWIGAGEDEGKLKRVPAPEGVIHIKP
jgi:Asp-tRNA(Asn)/Glu-tRNA(Gln) amidotransferase A subunit family amidase